MQVYEASQSWSFIEVPKEKVEGFWSSLDLVQRVTKATLSWDFIEVGAWG